MKKSLSIGALAALAAAQFACGHVQAQVPQSFKRIACKKPCIIRLQGQGELNGLGVDDSGQPVPIQSPNFSAPAHFRINWSWRCGADAQPNLLGALFSLSLVGYDSRAPANNTSSADRLALLDVSKERSGHNSQVMDTQGRHRYVFHVVTQCSWTIRAVKVR